jgi:hypothetical protein
MPRTSASDRPLHRRSPTDRAPAGGSMKPAYRRTSHTMIERTALTINIVVIGKKSLNPVRSMTMSPGRWNKCNLFSHGQASPATTSTLPSATRNRFIVRSLGSQSPLSNLSIHTSRASDPGSLGNCAMNRTMRAMAQEVPAYCRVRVCARANPRSHFREGVRWQSRA